MVLFLQSYSYNQPFVVNHNADVALDEVEFDTPGVGGAQGKACGIGAGGAEDNMGGCYEPSNRLGRCLETATSSAQFSHLGNL